MRSPFASEKAIAKPLPTARGVTVTSAAEASPFTRSVPRSGSTVSTAPAVRTAFPSRANGVFGQSPFRMP